MFDVHILGVNGEWIEMADAPEQDAEEDLVSGASQVVEEEIEESEKQCMCTRELRPVKCANGVTYPSSDQFPHDRNAYVFPHEYAHL